ncbi:Fe-S cluster assembly protein HesB [Planococcus sp. CPCC 101016]|uniref:3-hexulose-6-phosphate synthase n=1 Tax=Planococcus sp. CPCC 101016 TaxID=2599617 RepID=UPI0011B3FF6F|nr:3-hexulose-6-phosphate synthase [Planococcus sp. CPCC 101016]TWT05287.1 Fe-S cluster assembly protein HesB [Planococcus sp. CPCC 101016]
MKFQLALDRLTKEECFAILEETALYIDWIEVGTGVIKEYGMSIVRDIKAAYPQKILVADMKTCDAGKHEALQAFEAGADIMTVMAFSADKTIIDALEAAKKSNKRVMVDLLGVTDSHRLKELQRMGVDLVGLHHGKDMQLEKEMSGDLLMLAQGSTDLEVAIAGGITKESLPALLDKKLTALIIGSAITKAANPGQEAKEMKEVAKRFEIDHPTSS